MEIIDRIIDDDKLIRRLRTPSGMIESNVVMTKDEFLMAYREWMDDTDEKQIEKPDQGEVYRRISDHKAFVVLSRFLSADQDIYYMDKDGKIYAQKYANFIKDFYYSGYSNHISAMIKFLSEF